MALFAYPCALPERAHYAVMTVIRAAGANHVDIVEYLLEAGAPVNCLDKCLRTPLHWAAISGHLDTAQVRNMTCGMMNMLEYVHAISCRVSSPRRRIPEESFFLEKFHAISFRRRYFCRVSTLDPERDW